MISRRKFIQHSSLLATAGILQPAFSGADLLSAFKPPVGVGLQLYTVGNLMEADARGTLQKLASIGFKELESAGSAKGSYYGYTSKQFAAMVKDLGMNWRSEHVAGFPITMSEVLKMAKTAEDSAKIQKMAPMIEGMAKMPNLKSNGQQLVDEAAEAGVNYLVCAGVPVDTMDAIKAAVELFNRTGELCKKAGLQFAYHNHHFEFVPVNGTVPFDYLMSHTDKGLVSFELDLGWASVAGQDPVAIFKKYPGRIPLWHVKDMDKATMSPVEIGAGFIDFKRIFENKNLSGLKYYFVEQDDAPNPLENITHSYAQVKKIEG